MSGTLAVGLACRDQRRCMRSSSTLEALRNDGLYKYSTRLLYCTHATLMALHMCNYFIVSILTDECRCSSEYECRCSSEYELPDDDRHITEGVNLSTVADSCLSVFCVLSLFVCLCSVCCTRSAMS